MSTEQLDATEVDLGPKPHHIEVSRDGATIAVGLFGTNAVALIDTETGRSGKYTSSANPAAAAHGIYLLDETLYVAHETGDEVTAVDTATGDVVFSIGEISEPSEVLPDASARRLYVSARGEDTIKIIDLNTHSIVGEVEVGDQPEGLLLTDDQGTLIVSMPRHTSPTGVHRHSHPRGHRIVDLAGARHVRRPRRHLRRRPLRVRHLRPRRDRHRGGRRRRRRAPRRDRHLDLPRRRPASRRRLHQPDPSIALAPGDQETEATGFSPAERCSIPSPAEGPSTV